MDNTALFQPLTLQNGITIKNRFLKPAMSEVMGDSRFAPTPQLISLYRHWAAGGTGLLITGNVMVDSHHLGEHGNVVMENDENLNALKQWAQAGSQNGTQMWVQLNHPGRQSPKNVNKQPVAPSAVPMTGANAFGFNHPRALTVAEIHQIVDRFAVAADIAQRAGFGGVEIHAAHGYLLSQFLSPITNQRTDDYGGSLPNRMRIIKEIYLAMRRRVGKGFPIALKINSSDFQDGGFSEADSISVIHQMAALGVDLIEVSGGNYESPAMQANNSKGAFFVDYAAKAKQGLSIPVAVTGGFKTVAGMAETISNHEAEMIGLARATALIPDLPNQVEAGNLTDITLDRLTTGIGALDRKVGSLIGLSYYEMQMARIGQGKSVKRTTNAWQPLWFSLKSQGLSMLMPQRG